MEYTLIWYESGCTYELPYETLAQAQLHFDWLVSQGLEPTIKCEVLN